MKKISELLPNIPIASDYDQLIESLLEHPQIRSFAIVNDLKHNTLIEAMNVLLTFRQEHDLCMNCSGLDSCKSIHPGMEPKLVMNNGNPSLQYKPCRHNVNGIASKTIHISNLLRTTFETADLSDMDSVGESRRRLYSAITNIINNVKQAKPTKGLYIHGLPRIGKTFALSCVAKELSKLGKSIIFSAYPDLVREFKSSIYDGSLESKTKEYKDVDVLFINEFGITEATVFIRDEVIGPILQHRLNERKLTFFGSVFKADDVIELMTVGPKTIEKVRAAKILALIREMTQEYEIKEKPIRSA